MNDRETTMHEMWPEGLPDGSQPPLHHQMGLRLRQLSPTTVLTRDINDTTRGLRPVSVHGGMLAAFSDVASAVALWDTRSRE